MKKLSFASSLILLLLQSTEVQSVSTIPTMQKSSTDMTIQVELAEVSSKKRGGSGGGGSGGGGGGGGDNNPPQPSPEPTP